MINSAPSILHLRADSRTLGLVRVWVFGIWFMKIAMDPFPSLAKLPSEIFLPLGILRMIPKECWTFLLTEHFLWGLKIALCMSLCLVVLGVWIRPMAFVSLLGLLFHQGYIRGFGFINHAELPLLYAAMILSVLGDKDASARTAIQKGPFPASGYTAPLLLIQFIICLAFCYMGTHRLIYGRWAMFHTDALLQYIMQRSFEYRYYSWGMGTLLLQHPWLYRCFQLGFLVVTIFEALAPLAIISRRFRILFLIVLSCFHVAVLLFLDIFFWELCLLYVVFFDLQALSTKLSGLFTKNPRSSDPLTADAR